VVGQMKLMTVRWVLNGVKSNESIHGRSLLEKRWAALNNIDKLEYVIDDSIFKRLPSPHRLSNLNISLSILHSILLLMNLIAIHPPHPICVFLIIITKLNAVPTRAPNKERFAQSFISSKDRSTMRRSKIGISFSWTSSTLFTTSAFWFCVSLRLRTFRSRRVLLRLRAHRPRATFSFCPQILQSLW
jgi:hypothetical protein